MNNFLLDNYLDDQFYVLDQISPIFLKKMEMGLNREGSSSLLMLPSYAMVGNSMERNKKIVVIDAGGTNLRIGLVWFDQSGKTNIANFKTMPMFGTQEVLGKDSFFDRLAELALPYLDETNLICISFAYPTVITQEMDGKIIKLVKELQITGVNGCFIAQEMKNKLKEHGKVVEIFVTNDTTATSFAGIADTMDMAYDAHIGVIVGTGMNTCYPEKYQNIKKLGNVECDQRMMINVESGNFDDIKRSIVDLDFDVSTVDPGYHVLEKMVSGGYLGGLCQSYIEHACEQKLFSDQTIENLKGMKICSKEVSMFLDSKKDSMIKKAIGKKRTDVKNMKLLLSKIVRRAANLVALQIYSLCLKCAYPGYKICVTIEGTTFYKVPGMQEQTIEFLAKYLDKVDILFDIKHIDQAVMKGCAAIGIGQSNTQ